MLKNGLNKIAADRRDNSLLHTLHAYGSAVDPKGLPDTFSIYDGRPIPNQDDVDTRFNPQLPPLPMGCTGETGAFESGLQDGALYDPLFLYLSTPPYDKSSGRDIRTMLGVLKKSTSLRKPDGTFGPARGDYFNCYGSGNIDDFDAARIGLWINQALKRGVYIGSWFYPQFVGDSVASSGTVGLPSFNTSEASLHNYVATGWKTINGVVYLECITWQGMKMGNNGIEYMTREIYNALMSQPYTGAFTIAKIGDGDAVAIGWQAVVDHLVYFVLNLFPKTFVMPKPAPVEAPTPPPASVPSPDKLSEFCAAIQSREGYFKPGDNPSYPKGTPAWYNNNPGNLRCVEGNKPNWNRRATTGGAAHNNFCVFPDYATGLRALKDVVEAVCLGESPVYNAAAKTFGHQDGGQLTIAQYFVIRDPKSDGNDPASFAAEVAGKLKVSVDTPMHDLLV